MRGSRGSLVWWLFALLAVLSAVGVGAFMALRGHRGTSARSAHTAQQAHRVHTVAARRAPDGAALPVATVTEHGEGDGGRGLPWLNTRAELRLAWDLALGRPGSREILFTFDDGPNPGTTERLLNLLDRYHHKAVFFVCGWRLETNQEPLRTRAREVLREIVHRGHVVGSHTVNHHNLATLSPERTLFEVQHNAELIEEVLGQRPHLFRSPYGSYSEPLRDLLVQNGNELMLWSIDSHDWQLVGDAEAVAMNVIRLIGNMAGGTVLMHDIHPWSVTAAQMIFQWIQRENRERVQRGRPPYRVLDAYEYMEGERARLELLQSQRDGGAPLDAAR